MGRSLSDYAIVVQAALLGQGIALGYVRRSVTGSSKR